LYYETQGANIATVAVYPLGMAINMALE